MTVANCLSAAAKRGFTLIELMVVVVILATLVGLGAIGVSKTMRGAETTKRTSFTRVVSSAIAAYKNEKGTFPMPESLNLGNETSVSYGTVDNNNSIKEGNAEIIMMLLGRKANGARDDAERAYIADSSMLYICQGKRVSKLDDVLARGSISTSDVIGFPITMAKTNNSKKKALSKARAFAPIKITLDFDLDDSKVSIAAEGDFNNVVKLN